MKEDVLDNQWPTSYKSSNTLSVTRVSSVLLISASKSLNRFNLWITDAT